MISIALFLRANLTAKAVMPLVDAVPATIKPTVAKQNGHIIHLLVAGVATMPLLVGLTGEEE